MREVYPRHDPPPCAVLASAAYDRAPGGEPRRITREDGSAVDLSYDGALRLTEEEHRDDQGGVVESLTYTYDAAGNRLTRPDNEGSRTYTYLPGYQLAASSLPAGDESYTHDTDGRVRQITRGGETWELSWDEDDRLSAVTGREGGPVTYTHDADGRRVRAVFSGGERRMLVARPGARVRPPDPPRTNPNPRRSRPIRPRIRAPIPLHVRQSVRVQRPDGNVRDGRDQRFEPQGSVPEHVKPLRSLDTPGEV
jgi:YD repeat-containing protein